MFNSCLCTQTPGYTGSSYAFLFPIIHHGVAYHFWIHKAWERIPPSEFFTLRASEVICQKLLCFFSGKTRLFSGFIFLCVKYSQVQCSYAAANR